MELGTGTAREAEASAASGTTGSVEARRTVQGRRAEIPEFSAGEGR